MDATVKPTPSEVLHNLNESIRDVCEHSADVAYGEEGTKPIYSWQASHPITTKCVHCGGMAHIAITVAEGHGQYDYACNHRPEGAECWLHDVVSVALYLCPACMEMTARYNQA